ncbi:transcription termination factor NusA [Trichococcus collinsii]|jgi:N utilization substance protein A|uniref:Transcription termination/antitermination protein NusA n=1 Tax=Trichococcus collinsii TaxID=157076 RepID=A0AB37ZWY2_9LACT|nr:transcription termination factor NusA [Trichococcus collinsii]CZQ81386.1 transcription termination factor nusa [Trichococcus collinsii]SDZ90175.1 NusA antitermination factor [Trichococcus collinsii]
MSKEMLSALEVLEKDKGISKEIVISALEAALVSAYKRNYGQAQNVEVEFDTKKGDIHVYAVKEVVDMVFDSTLEVSLEDALQINKAYELGDKIRFEVTPKDFGRIAAQTAKQVIMQRIREAERSIVYNQFIAYENDILTGVVERMDSRYIYVSLGKIEAVLSKQEQIPNETFQPHDRIKVYITKVENTSKGPQVFVSRSHPDLLKRLFEQEVPEIFDGVVEIVSIAREAGDRSKVAVRSRDKNVDPVGTCVGPRGQRVQAIVNELRGENMDIVEWNEDPSIYIGNALNPAQVVNVDFHQADGSCTVIVPDYQLSLAIGKKGQNARLAAKLTGYKIDIKSETEYNKLLMESGAQKVAADEEDADAINSFAGLDKIFTAEEVAEDIAVPADETDYTEEYENDEKILDPEDVEQLISEVETDPEQSYDELAEDYQD